MKLHIPTPSYRQLLLFSSLAEIGMGGAYLGILVLQSYQSVWCTVLRLLFQFLHLCMTAVLLTAALRRADRRNMRSALSGMAIFLGALTVKDFIGNFFSYCFGEGYLAGDALLLSLFDTALNTLLLDGLFLAVTFGLGYLLFLWAHAPSRAPASFDEVRGNYLLRAAVFVSALPTARLLGAEIVTLIQFLREVLWMPTFPEILSVLLEFVMILLSGTAAYFASYALLRYCPDGTEETEKPSPRK